MKLSDLLRMLEKQTGAILSIEPCHPAFSNVEDLKLQPDQYLHHSPYCVFAKQAGGIQICSENKKHSLKIADNGRAFAGICPNGIREIVQPISLDNIIVAVLYAGHLASSRKLATINGQQYSGPRPVVLSIQSEQKLRQQLRFVATLIRWEILLWQKQGGHATHRHDEQYYLDHVDFFIAHRYTENISLTELAVKLKINPNYLGGIINRGTGHNFRRLLNLRRVDEAKTYLRFHHSLNITEIATITGFADSNYFSTVFRQITGKSPRHYRNEK
jgi:AraC-like DNA-binding protein